MPLLVGILGTILLLASVIETLLEDRPETMAGLFCGLVAASAVSACRLFEWRGAVQIVLMAVAALATFGCWACSRARWTTRRCWCWPGPGP